jgi:signal peptidase I
VKRGRLIASGLMAGAVGVLALATRALIVKPFRIPLQPMAGTLRLGEGVLFNTAAYDRHEARRGHGPVFGSPKAPSVMFIERVLGVPGGTPQVREGRLYVNGEPAGEPCVCDTDGSPEPTPSLVPPDGSTMGRPWPPADLDVVPEGGYVVMSDDLVDGRDLGVVPRDSVSREGSLCCWPPDLLSPL